jgi:hypothetical protein
MSTSQTLRKPKAERLRSKPAPQSKIEIDEPEKSQGWFRRWRLEVDERERREGTFDMEQPTMEEIVAVCKEVRAEMYAEEQERKNAACH